eukprot:scaffold115145_cov55-Attheya_sp.AAC.1
MMQSSSGVRSCRLLYAVAGGVARKYPVVWRNYNTAIVREVPTSLSRALSHYHLAEADSDGISYDVARSQHNLSVEQLQARLFRVINLPASEKHPDCVFVEDSAVIIGNQAVVMRIGAPSRQGEVNDIKSVLEHELGVHVTDMREVDPEATCDGGDVLFPTCPTGDPSKGRHLFVGLSTRTNLAGFQILKDTFGSVFHNIEVIAVPGIHELGSLHLKSIMTHVNEDTLLVPQGAVGDNVLDAIRAKERGYTAIRLKDAAACNVVVVNNVVLAQPILCIETKQLLETEMKQRGLDVVYVDTSEFAKCDGSLTCLSLLLNI